MQVNEFIGGFWVIIMRGKKAWRARNWPKNRDTLQINRYLSVHQKIVIFGR